MLKTFKYRINEDIDKGKWADFVISHLNGNVFQTPEIYEIYKRTRNYEPFCIGLFNEKEDIEGILLAVVIKEYAGITGSFSSRSIITGGPLIKNDNSFALNCILKEYIEIIKSKAIYSQFRNMWDWKDFKDVFITNGFNFKDHLNIYIDLRKSENELWREVHSKRRNEIRKAKKEGVIFLIMNTENALKKCYSILLDVYYRAKLPLVSYDFFYNLYSMSSDVKLIIFCANYGHEIIGCILALTYKNTIHDLYAGSLTKFYSKYPNDLLPWEVFRWGKENKFEIFDFGGAGKPNIPYGVRDYKKKFGGALVNWGRFEKIHKPFLMKVGETGFKVWQKIKL